MTGTVLQPNDFDRLLSEMKSFVREELKSVQMPPENDRPICAKEAAAYLGIGQTTFWERIKTGKIPSILIHRNGGSVYFFKSELRQFLKAS
jgi:excisionase family DNA binding protein